MYDKIAYGITDEMIKRAVNTSATSGLKKEIDRVANMPIVPITVGSQELSGTNTSQTNPALTQNTKPVELQKPPVAIRYPFIDNLIGMPDDQRRWQSFYTPLSPTSLENRAKASSMMATWRENEQAKRQAQTPLAQEEARAMQYFRNWYDSLPEKSQAAARDPRFPYKGPHAAWFSKFMDGERAKFPQNTAKPQPPTPQLFPVQEGTNFSNRAYTPNAVARNSNGENYNTFEKGWMQNSLAPAQQPKQPSFNPDTTSGWGLWTPKQIDRYAKDPKYKGMTPEQFAQATTPEERTQLIKDYFKTEQKAKADSMTYAGEYDDKGVAKDQAAYEQAVNNWDNTYAGVESTIRTPSLVRRWKAKGFTDKEIDDYVKKETTKAMERRYGKRPVSAPVQPASVPEANTEEAVAEQTSETSNPSQVASTDSRSITDGDGQVRNLYMEKAESANIVALLLNKSKLALLKEYFNG